MTRIRIVASVLAVFTVLLGGLVTSTASAAPASPDGWQCDGDICLRYSPSGEFDPDDADGCSVDTCISVFGTAGGYSAVGYADDDWYGHVDLWGPGMPKHGTGDHSRPTSNGTGKGVGAACAEGWASDGGGRYHSVGLPCVNVR